MQATLTSLKNPIWANTEHTMIDCVITTSQFGDEKLPFTANPKDAEAHGRVLFERISSGEFGPIGGYVVPLPNLEQGQTPPSGEAAALESTP